MLRRDLLKMGSCATLSLLGSGFGGALLRAGDPPKIAPTHLDWNRCLVLIELQGGNDAMNMVVPYGESEYYKLRKTISLGESEIIKCTDSLGLHSALTLLQPAVKDGDLAILLGLGYPNPNRSHFRGIDIWNTASRSEEVLADGWLARILFAAQASAPPERLADSITLGYSTAYGGGGALYGHELNRLTMERPEDFVRRAKSIPPAGVDMPNPAVEHILHVQRDIAATAERLDKIYSGAPAPGPFPSTGLANHLQVAAKLISGGIVCPVFKLTIGGFDTHANQKPGQARLLTEVGEALAAFRTALKKTPGAWERTVVLTYSEFGRRAGENSSGGTDHGTAAAHLLMGGKVKGGIYGEYPSLTSLDNGDLMFTTDYRAVYQSIAQGWFGHHHPFLSESSIKPLPVFKT